MRFYWGRLSSYFDILSFHFQFFVAPPECCPTPKWFSSKFSTIYESFYSATKSLSSNLHLLPLYKTDPTMFELDGRHYKSYVGKDYLDR